MTFLVSVSKKCYFIIHDSRSLALVLGLDHDTAEGIFVEKSFWWRFNIREIGSEVPREQANNLVLKYAPNARALLKYRCWERNITLDELNDLVRDMDYVDRFDTVKFNPLDYVLIQDSIPQKAVSELIREKFGTPHPSEIFVD